MSKRLRKILIISSHYYTGADGVVVGGGEITMSEFVLATIKDVEWYVLTNNEELDKGYQRINDVSIYNIRPSKIPKYIPKSGLFNKVYLQNVFYRHAERLVRELKPDWLMSSAWLISTTQKLAQQFGVNSFMWIRAFENFYSMDLNYKRRSIHALIHNSLEKVIFQNVDKKAIKNATVVCGNSEYMCNKISEIFGRKAELIYPPINLRNSDNIHISDRNRIGFINPIKKKGYDIFLKLASEMKEFQFISFGKIPENIDEIQKYHNNISCEGWKKNIKDIFSNIDVLIVPSIWPEPFGRVAVEAIDNSVIPVVSNIGGLPETVNNNNLIVDNIHDIEEWKGKINRIFNDEKFRRLLLKEAKEHIKYFEVHNQASKLLDILQN